jgi:hypothetical protein
MIRTVCVSDWHGESRRARHSRRVVASLAALVVALTLGAMASPGAQAAPRRQPPSLVRVLGQPSTAQAVPHGYSPKDQVQCWYHNALQSLGPGKYYVSTELAYPDTGPYADKGMLRARQRGIGPWELYTVCYDYTDESYSILSEAAGAWVSAEIHYPTDPENREGMLRARADSVGPWEKYNINTNASGEISIWSLAKNRYVSAELAYSDAGPYPHKGMLRARNRSVGPWEVFYLQSLV